MTRLKQDRKLKSFEKLIEKSQTQNYKLSLYIAGTTRLSTEAVSNISGICREYLEGRYDLEIIDIFQQPEIARSKQILVSPTLIKESPLPHRRLVGDLSNQKTILKALELPLESKGRRRKPKA